jgi:hypothetical protein
MRRDVPVAKILRRPSALIPDDLAEAVLFLQAGARAACSIVSTVGCRFSVAMASWSGRYSRCSSASLLSGRSSFRGPLTSWSGPLRRRLAAVAGFFQLPTSSSLSRARRTYSTPLCVHMVIGRPEPVLDGSSGESAYFTTYQTMMRWAG